MECCSTLSDTHLRDAYMIDCPNSQMTPTELTQRTIHSLHLLPCSLIILSLIVLICRFIAQTLKRYREVETQRTTVSQMEFEAGPSTTTSVPVRDTEADAASHSSSSSLPGGAYEVFLSFRGPDTRYGFADYLFRSLIQSGVRTFRDDEEVRQGTKLKTELEKGIRDSKISIPIFSKRYAESKWCLMELLLMLECQSQTKPQLILPIFYHVTPDEVKLKHRGGTFERALNKLEESLKESGEFREDDMMQWKEALTKAGKIPGWEVDEKRYEGGLITNEIVPRVQSELKIKIMDVTTKLVGMDHHKNEMRRLLDISSDDVNFVGIYGMTGIGKTTVAKCIYNELLQEFDCCSFLDCSIFLEDIQKEGKLQGTIASLQKQLCIDALNWSVDIANVEAGKDSIKKKFCNKKVLFVLDDVSSISFFDFLLGEPNCLVAKDGCFGKGSKIIVTTKDKGVLNDLKVERTYQLPFMDDSQSLQLFCMHAFDAECPPNEYDSFSREIASFAGGLPLALESMGSSLHGQNDLEIWKAASKKFAKTTDDNVLKKLEVDYKSLNPNQRQMFLDVACLFVGMDKRTVFYLWDAREYDPEREFEKLKLRSLVKVGDANELRMHNQLIALGKDIVKKENNFFGNRSRLWNPDEAQLILEGRMVRSECTEFYCYI
ncbi:disease resistance protein L6-like [Cornus florida]|uniref:disease resistance protein L6-like n=1 Tax=Cornus florida TaxID=4283 RepID=UPI0028984B86|nr:disease resistance protein L6-like [Cornus florida]